MLVTHSEAQARRLADWVVRIDEGRVVAQGPTEEALAAEPAPAPEADEPAAAEPEAPSPAPQAGSEEAGVE